MSSHGAVLPSRACTFAWAVVVRRAAPLANSPHVAHPSIFAVHTDFALQVHDGHSESECSVTIHLG